MLQHIRDRAQGIFAWIIIILLILGLSSFILSSYLGSDISSYVAKVNDVDISEREYAYERNRILTEIVQTQGPEAASLYSEDQLKPFIVDNLIRDELIRQYIYDSGFRASDQRIVAEIRKIPGLSDETGEVSSGVYQDFLSQTGVDAQTYEASIASQVSYQQYQDSFITTAFITNKDVDDYLKLQRQTREIGYVYIPVSYARTKVTVTDEEIKQYYEANPDLFKTQDQVQMQYIEITRVDLFKTIEINEEDVRNYYEATQGEYIFDDVATAKQRANEIRSRAINGEDFAALAAEHSKDSFSAKNGGELPPMMRGEYSKDFEDAVFSLQPGEISEPVKTDQGVHIIKLEEVVAGDIEQRRVRHILIEVPKSIKPFEEVRELIVEQLRNQEADDQYYQKLTKLDKLTFVTDQHSLDTAAEQLTLEIKTGPFITRQGGPQFWRNSDVITASFSEEVLNEKLNSQVIKLSEDHAIVMRVSEYKAAELKPLSEVEPEIREFLTQKKAADQTSIIADTIKGDIASGKPVQEATRGMSGVTWSEVGMMGRHESFDPSPLATAVIPEVRQIVFTMNKPGQQPEYLSTTLQNGDGVVIVLRKVDTPDVNQLSDAQRKEVRNQLQSEQTFANEAVLVAWLRTHAEIIIPQPKAEDIAP